MASAWGSAWGDAWAAAWEVVAGPPAPPAGPVDGGWNFARAPALEFIEQQNRIAVARVIAFITSGSMQ